MGVSSPSSCDELPRVAGDRLVRVVVDLAAGHDRHPLVEQAGERADHAGLGLAPLAQEDDVVPGEEGVLELRHDGLLVADEATEERLAGGDLGHGVAADLVLDRDGLPAGGPELAEGGHRRRRGAGGDGHGSTIPPPARGEPAGRTPHDSPIGARRDLYPGSAMDLSGPWRAALADDDLRRGALGLDYDDDGWEAVPVPGHWRSTPAFADERRSAALPDPLRARRRTRRRPPLAGPRRRLLPGRRVARRRLPR